MPSLVTVNICNQVSLIVNLTFIFVKLNLQINDMMYCLVIARGRTFSLFICDDLRLITMLLIQVIRKNTEFLDIIIIIPELLCFYVQYCYA